MRYLSEVLSHLNPFSTVESGFLKTWLRKYYQTSDLILNQNYYHFILLFIIFMSIRTVKVLSIDHIYDDRLLIYLGSFAQLLGGPPKYYEFLFLMWSANFIGFYCFLINRKRYEFLWLELFGSFDGMVDHKSIGLKDYVSKLKTRASIGYFLSNYCIRVITIFGSLALTIIMYVNYKTHDFFIFGIIWITIWSVWMYYASVVIYWFPTYFYIICYYMKIQLKFINRDIKNIKLTKIPIQLKEILLIKLLVKHQNIYRKIKIYNNYWKKYLSQSFIIFLTIILFLSYLYFFTSMTFLPKFEFTIVLTVHVLILIVLTYSASSVSHFSTTTYKLLQSISVEKFSIRSKLKVSKNFYLND
jgi:hypothetical protein